MKKIFTLKLPVIILITFYCQNISANEYYSWLSAKYPDGSVKTFLQGPYETKSICEELNLITWNNTFTACGNCTKKQFYCGDTHTLQEGYKKILRGEKSFVPYVVATSEGRIFFSGVHKSVAQKECKRLAALFKENAYEKARCVLP